MDMDICPLSVTLKVPPWILKRVDWRASFGKSKEKAFFTLSFSAKLFFFFKILIIFEKKIIICDFSTFLGFMTFQY